MPEHRTEPTFDPSALPTEDFLPDARDVAPVAPAAAAAPVAPAHAPAPAPAPATAAPAAAPAAPAVDEAELARLEADVQALKSRNAELSEKNHELSEQVLRAQAEMQNTRRRAEDEMSKARKFAVESFADSMLPVADSLEAGLAIKDATPEQIREGAEATLRQLKSVLERNKVIEINPAAGTRFDPHQHQAISVVPAPEGSPQEPNTVVTVLQKGYSIAERVLRPALVTVTAGR
jgi:molecular chaperone GrpE